MRRAAEGARSRPRLVAGGAALLVVAVVAGGLVVAQARTDETGGPWQAPVWTEWPEASIQDVCTTGVCVADNVALPLGRPVEAAVDVEMPDELGALSVERVWIGERAGLFGKGWATIWDVRLQDGLFTGPLPSAPVEAPHEGDEVALQDGSTVRVDDQGRLEEVCLDAALCTRAEWSDDALVLRSVLDFKGDAGSDPDDAPTVTLTLEEGRVVGAEATDGRTVEYRYESGLLGTVVRDDGETIYGYETGRLAAIDDGVRRTYAYDGAGRVMIATDVDGGRWTIGKPPPAGWLGPAAAGALRSFQVKSPQGWTRTYRFAGGSLVEAIDHERGVMLRREVAGDGSVVEERPLDGLRSVRTADELLVTEEVGDGPTRTARYEFDDEGRVVRTVTPNGTTSVRYDGGSHRPVERTGPEGSQTVQYDSHGLLAETEDADGYRVEVQRNDLGQAVVLSDGVQRTEFSYDEAGRTIEERSGGSTSSATYRADGLVDSLTAAGDDSLAAAYDDFDRLTSLGGDPAGSTSSPEADEVAAPAEIEAETTERPDGTYQLRYPSGETLVLDQAGRPVRVTVDGRSESRRYDDAGRLVELDLPGGPTYELTYTDAGRVATVTDGTVTAALTWHGDLLLSAETSAGTAYEYEYDEAGRLQSATSGPLRWDYSYDEAGRSSTVHGPSGVIRTEWDDEGRPVEVSDGGHREGYGWEGDGLDLATVQIDDDEVLRFDRDDTGRVVEISQADRGTAELNYDPETGALTSYWLDGDDDVMIGYDDEGRVATLESGDRTETWTWDEGEVAEVDVAGEDDPYRLEWLAPGLLGRVERGDDLLLRTTVDDAGRPTAMGNGDDITATLTWATGGLVEALLGKGPSATIERDDELRPTRVELDDRRIDWQYEDGALAEIDDGEHTTAFAYEDGRLQRTAVQHDDETSTITWDPSRARPTSIDTAEGESTFRYRDGKVQSLRIDGEDQELRYEDGRPNAEGDGDDLLDALFDETGRYRTLTGRSLASPSAPWFDSLPEEFAIALPEVVTGRQVAQAAIEDQLPTIPSFLVDDPNGLAERTAQGLVGASLAEAVLGGPDKITALGLEVDGDDLSFEFAGASDALAVRQAIEILGPGPGLVERVVDFGQSVVGVVGRGLQAVQRFLRDDARGQFLLNVVYMVADYLVPTACGVGIGLLTGAAAGPEAGVPAGLQAAAVCKAIASAGLRATQALVTAAPGQALVPTAVAASIRPITDVVSALRTVDPVATVLAAGALLPLPKIVGELSRRGATQALAAACGLRRILCISAARFGAAADHVADAQRGGAPRALQIDRAGAAARRSTALRGLPTRSGFDRDEYPFALSSRRSGLSVRYIDPASNRALGAYLGDQTRGLPDGAWFYVLPIA